MIIIEIGFLAGKFHATPWDRHVNEGIEEWPPSPWRILRALISTWHQKAKEDISEAIMQSLVTKLASLPRFYLPPATLGHTRHYMPLYRSSLDGKTTKVFDTFIKLEPDERIQVIWQDITLSEDELKALGLLVFYLNYFGRAESWVEASILEGASMEANSIPLDDGVLPPAGYELVRTMAIMAPEDYLTWREKTLAIRKDHLLSELSARAAEKGKPADKIQLTKKNLKEIEESLPDNLFGALHADTADLKRAGWNQPPGSRWVGYARRRDCFDAMPKSRVGSTQAGESKPTIARFAVASQATPRLTDTISLAERIHVALVSKSDGSPVFTGCDESGKPLKDHKHAHILCESNLDLGRGRRGEITHVTIYAPMGFGQQERRAIDDLVKVWGYGGHDVQLILLGVGRPNDFAGLDTNKGACPILSVSRVWISRTPFIPTRHPKSSRSGKPKLDENGLQIGSPEHELRRLIRFAGFPKPVRIVSVHSTDLAGHETSWLHFRRERTSGNGSKATNIGYGFIIEFAEPVNGPIAVGYGSHFGLGLFVPVEKERKF